MKYNSTIFLRGVVVTLGLIVLGLCIIAVPAGIQSDTYKMYHPILSSLYVPAIPYFFALFQTMKLLGFIDQNKAFSDASVSALKAIKYCAVSISGLFIAASPYVYYVADKNDALGVLVLVIIIIFASVSIATFAAVLQKILADAMVMKSEHDLTV